MRKFTSEERPRKREEISFEDEARIGNVLAADVRRLGFPVEDEDEAEYIAEFAYLGRTKDGAEILNGGEVDFYLFVRLPNGETIRRDVSLFAGGDLGSFPYGDDIAENDPIYNPYVLLDFAERLTAEELLAYVDGRISGEITEF